MQGLVVTVHLAEGILDIFPSTSVGASCCILFVLHTYVHFPTLSKSRSLTILRPRHVTNYLSLPVFSSPIRFRFLSFTTYSVSAVLPVSCANPLTPPSPPIHPSIQRIYSMHPPPPYCRCPLRLIFIVWPYSTSSRVQTNNSMLIYIPTIRLQGTSTHAALASIHLIEIYIIYMSSSSKDTQSQRSAWSWYHQWDLISNLHTHSVSYSPVD